MSVTFDKPLGDLWDVTMYLEELEDLFCFNCGERDVKLSRCSRCHSSYYCSKKCQTNDYPYHKVFCLHYKKLNKRVNKERKKLEKALDFYGNRFSYFTKRHKHIGHFWSLIEPRNYCRATYSFAEHILEQAHNYDCKPLWEIGLSHHMELLRLIHGDNMGIRDKVPFILIELNRDNDAYNFVKWWLTIDPDGTYDWGNPPDSEEGDWLYLKNQNIFENFGQFYSTKYISLAHLATLTLLKLRLSAKMRFALVIKDALKTQIKSASAELGMLNDVNNDYSGSISDIIVSYIDESETASIKSGDLSKEIKIQSKYSDILLKEMFSNNKMFLQSLVNPDPMGQDRHYPSSHSRGSAEEAYLVMKDCYRLYKRTPMAKRRLQQLVGENPQYEPRLTFDCC